MDDVAWFRKRLTELRLQKGISARDMSLSLGQSESYINKIENRHTLPSMTGFFYICEFLGVTPAEFFDPQALTPQTARELLAALNRLKPEQARHVLQIVEDLSQT